MLFLGQEEAQEEGKPQQEHHRPCGKEEGDNPEVHPWQGEDQRRLQIEEHGEDKHPWIEAQEEGYRPTPSTTWVTQTGEAVGHDECHIQRDEDGCILT